MKSKPGRMRHRTPNTAALGKYRRLLIVTLIIVVGTSALIFVIAAPQTAHIEPESGSLSNVKLVDDSFASNGKAIKFGSATALQKRDAFWWPYSKYSIWNMPIGADADYQPANLQTPNSLDPDLALILRDSPGAPKVSFHDSNYEWAPYSSRCGTAGNVSWNVSIPPIATGLFSRGGNNHVSIFANDLSGRTDIETAALCSNNTVVGGGSDLVKRPLNDMGNVGLQGGSGLPATGGAIRKEEMSAGTPIRHSLAMILEGWKYLQKCNYRGNGKNDTYRWPAQWSDAYACNASDGYGGTKDYFRMGSLLALPAPGKVGGVDLGANQLGLQTDMGKKIAQALQEYGVYVADDSYGSPGDDSLSYMGFKVSVDALQQWSDTNGGEIFLDDVNTPIGRDMQKIIPKLYVVANNGPTSVGGPGVRIACFAPDFLNLSDAISNNPNGTTGAQPARCK